jgi:UDP-N-acetylglucosamine 2-epimerase (non-hydrolysing)
LVDGPLLSTAVAQLRRVSRELPVVFPVHPRTRPLLSGLDPGPRVHLTDPLTYVDFMSLQSDARAVMTDSGGVQEETTFLGVPCFTLRDNTERPITVTAGTNTLLGLDPERIADILPALERWAPTAGGPPALWDGRAGERVADVLVQSISRAGERMGAH